MRSLRSVVLLLSGAAACAVPPASVVPRPGHDAARIGAVLDGLSPAVEAANAPPVRYALKDRLKAYHTPGIVIAVIRGDTVAWVYATGVRKAGSLDSMSADAHFIVQSI